MRKKSKGQLLILVLGVMGMGMIVIGPLLAYVDLSLRLSLQSALKNSAYYAAEAGIQMFIGDLYQANVNMSKTYTGTMNDYNFNTTVTNSSGAASLPTDRSAYFDPGITMYMRPMNVANRSYYAFVASAGKDLKINWAGYTSDTQSPPQPYDFTFSTKEKLNVSIVLHKGNRTDPIVASKTPTPEELYASDEARVGALTLFVPGANISGGLYTAEFINLAFRDPPYGLAYACSMFYMSEADAQVYTFNGSINRSCSHFVDDTGNVTVMLINEDNGDLTGTGWGTGRDVNTFSFFCDYVELRVTSNVTGTTKTNIYTYNATNASTGNNRSYTGAITVGSGGDRGKPGSTIYHDPAIYGGDYFSYDNKDYYANYVTQRINASAIELDAGNYSRISAADGNRRLATYDPRLVGLNNSCMWHVFRIPEGINASWRSKISKIEVHWEGYQTKAAPRQRWWGDEDNRDNDQLYLLLWNDQDTVSTADDRYHILARKQQDAGYTWVKIAQGGYADYLITSTSSRDGEDAITITCYIRQTPGPSLWWEEQSLEILSWNVQIH